MPAPHHARRGKHPLDTTEFIAALLSIIVIDIVLAGDNAIVIALAARRLPAHLQKRAIVWGAVGAIAVRSLMTLGVVWLLRLPGLRLVGGVLLLWIAWRLLADAGDTHDETDGGSAITFWAAMRTIIVADAVMGLDNVLAVAGAARGSYLLVVTGLVVSVPLVVWGSTVVLKIVRRFPAVVYLGAGVLAWTAVEMIRSEPLLEARIDAAPALALLAWLVVPLLLCAGWVANHRRVEARLQAQFARRAAAPAAPGGTPPEREGEPATSNVLVAVDGSANSLLAVRRAVADRRGDPSLVVHLINVQPRLPRQVVRFVGRGDREAWLGERAAAALRPAQALLAEAGVAHRAHWVAGDRAAEICAAAGRLRADRILMGVARKNSLTRMFEDSVAERVLQGTPLPVELVIGDAVPGWERWGVPAGVLAGAVLLLLLASTLD